MRGGKIVQGLLCPDPEIMKNSGNGYFIVLCCLFIASQGDTEIEEAQTVVAVGIIIGAEHKPVTFKQFIKKSGLANNIHFLWFQLHFQTVNITPES